MLDFLVLQRSAFSKTILDVHNLPVEDAFVVLRFDRKGGSLGSGLRTPDASCKTAL